MSARSCRGSLDGKQPDDGSGGLGEGGERGSPDQDPLLRSAIAGTAMASSSGKLWRASAKATSSPSEGQSDRGGGDICVRHGKAIASRPSPPGQDYDLYQ